MIITFDDKQLLKDIMSVTQYSEGFLDGIHAGEPEFLKEFGKEIIATLKEFIDSNARVDPQALQHVYEWYMNGSADARLYDITYHEIGNGLSFGYNFSQSISLKQGSTTPFYDKARIMEEGIPVTIKPVKSDVLAFDINGESIFTKSPIEVPNPGGDHAKHGFQKVFDSFFTNYFTQSFLIASGMVNYLNNPFLYSENFRMAKSGGKQLGYKTGLQFIAKAATGGSF